MMTAQFPAHHLAVTKINHHCQIAPNPIDFKIGRIATKHSCIGIGCKLTVQMIDKNLSILFISILLFLRLFAE